jgi:hypothetical protein
LILFHIQSVRDLRLLLAGVVVRRIRTDCLTFANSAFAT